MCDRLEKHVARKAGLLIMFDPEDKVWIMITMKARCVMGS